MRHTCLLIGMVVCPCATAAPELLHVRARHAPDGHPATGNVAVVVRLFTNPTPTPDEEVLFAEAAVVPAVDGVLDMLVGAQPAAGTLTGALTRLAVYLELEAGGTVLAPRRRMTSSAYALQARDVSTLQAATPAVFARLGASNAWTGAQNVFRGSLAAEGNLRVKSHAAADGGLTVENDAIIRGDMFTDGSFYMVGSLTVAGAQGLTVDRDLQIKGGSFADGAMSVSGGARVDGRVAAPNATREYVITDFGAVGDGFFDNAPIINSLIQRLPPTGGTIVVPHGEFRVNSPIVIDRSFVTLRGLSDGQRSNMDGRVPGLEFIGGGSKIAVGVPSGQGAIVAPAAAGRLSGLALRSLNLAGFGGAAGQTGILIDRASDGLTIAGVACANLHYAVFIRDADRARIAGCWLAECGVSLRMQTGLQCIVDGNRLGAQPHDITCELIDHRYLTFRGNVVFPNGYTALRLLNCHHSLVTANQFNSWFTGALEVFGNGNTIAHNNLHAKLDEGGGWAGDPRGRDGRWGFIHVRGNDNLFASNIIASEQPENDTRILLAGGINNHFSDLAIAGRASVRKLVVDASCEGTRVIHALRAGELEDFSGSTYVVALP